MTHLEPKKLAISRTIADLVSSSYLEISRTVVDLVSSSYMEISSTVVDLELDPRRRADLSLAPSPIRSLILAAEIDLSSSCYFRFSFFFP